MPALLKFSVRVAKFSKIIFANHCILDVLSSKRRGKKAQGNGKNKGKKKEEICNKRIEDLLAF